MRYFEGDTEYCNEGGGTPYIDDPRHCTGQSVKDLSELKALNLDQAGKTG